MPWVYYVTNKLGKMSDEDKNNNATMIYNQLGSYGWTLNAICGVLGNMTVESQLNPAQTQVGYPIGSLKGGYGLVQWTPASKYVNWARANNHNITDGYWQLYDLSNQAHGTEYYATSSFPLSYDEFKVSDETPAYLTEAFLKNYERAGVEVLSKRVEWAEHWYEYLSGQPAPVPPVPPTPKRDKSGLPVWMMIKYV